jgi:hypothetical protein
MKQVMTKLLKSLSLAAVVAFAAPSQAANVNIGGLSVPTGGNFEVASIYENVIFGLGQELKGVGEITQINGQAISSLCAGCELTYSFDSYIVNSLTSTSIGFTGGVMKIYLGFGANNDFNPFGSGSYAADVAAATNGTLFLTLAGHAVNAAGETFVGGGTNIGLATAAGTGSGLADVVLGGGIASSNFDTDSIATLFGGPSTDFQLGSSFSSIIAPNCTGAPAFLGCLGGSADLRGLVIPEPGSMALFGVALLGLAASAKRRRS